MSIRLKRAFISIFAVFTLLFLSLGFVLTKPAKADEGYTSPLPDGAYIAEYQVLDINKGGLTGSTITAQEAMGDASAVRFKLTATAGNTWASYISLYSTDSYFKGNNNNGSFYFTFRKNSAATGKIQLNILSGNNPVNDIGWDNTSLKCMEFDYPSWFDLSVAGNSYDIEVGGVKVLNSADVWSGTLIYMEVDGVRVAEYYYANGGLSFDGDNFNYSANQTAGSLTTTELGAIDANTATVEFANESYLAGEQLVPAVTLVREKEGVSYGSVIAPQYYDVSYTDNDKTGTATANITFKGKYSGTATATFNVVSVEDMYKNPLPEGAYIADYTVLDIAKEYGTDGVYTATTTGEQGILLGLKGANAYKFKLSQTTNPWAVRLGIYNTESYLKPNNSCAYVCLRTLSLDVLPNESTITPNVSFEYPTGITYTTPNTAYEFGGLKVLDASGNYIGRLFYLEINGMRVLEKFCNIDDKSIFDDDMLCITNVASAGVQSTLTFTSPEAEDLTDKTAVSFGTDYEVVDGVAMLKPVVYRITERNGKSYVGIVEEKYYDVEYVAVGKAGTANITFKDKYSGTATGGFTLPDLMNANGAVVTLVATCFTENVDDTPITPLVVAVEKDGKAIPETCYSVSYADNIEVGTGKVIVTFKNGYFGKAEALFRINPIMTENHFLDENPVILDIAETYGGETGKIELTEVKNYGYDGVGGFFDMNDADVVRFKMTTNKNTWNEYFALFCSDVYYKGENAGMYYALPNSGSRKLELSVVNKAAKVLAYATDRPADFDISAESGTTVNVEIGAVKVFYNDDGDISYVGRKFYIAFDGKVASEYVYLNSELKFEGGNFFIGGNTDKIVIEKYDLPETGAVGGQSAGAGVSATTNGINNGASLTATGEKKNKAFIPVLAVIGLTGIVGVAYVLLRKHKKSEK